MAVPDGFGRADGTPQERDEQAPSLAEGARLLAIILTATLFSVMNSTMVNVAIPSFMRDFHIGLAASVWLYTGYVLPYAISTPLFGVLGEHVGAKRVFIAGCVAFLITSLLCSTAWGFAPLLVFRALQALASGAVVANALVLVTAGFPRRQRGLVLGIWSAVSGVAVSIGLTLAGWLIEYESWRAIFWVNAPFLLAVAIVGSKCITELPRSARGREFDITGGVVLAIGVGGLILALTEGQLAGWTSAITLALFVIAPLGIVTFLLWESRTADPLMPRSLVRRPAYAFASATMFLQSVVFFGLFLLLPLYLQELRGRTPLETGIMTLPLSVVLIVVGPLAGRLSSRIGPRLPTTAGLLLIAAGSAVLSRLTLQSGYPLLAAGLVITGIGIGASISPLTSTAMSAAASDERGAASGFFNLVRFVGAVIGTTLLSTILSTRTSAAASTGMAHLPAMAQGFHDVYLAAAALALVGVVAALFIPPARPA
ncbi:MAG TPA: DHA2 family efflux MFS transporter permease subunit [Chloroflexota bacterium]|nr:DHA2 family efflux MFS transporter permease subunit [Chloroflexota bacterium]